MAQATQTVEKKGFSEDIALPQGVTASLDGPVLVIRGKSGELRYSFLSKKVSIGVEGNAIRITAKFNDKPTKKLFGSVRAHIKNKIAGVQEPHTYEMKICSGHFPMNVEVKGQEFIIRNFFGEKIPRTVRIHDGVKVEVKGQEVFVTSVDIELAGRTAAAIEQRTKRANFDRRIFQDGIYITKKAGRRNE